MTESRGTHVTLSERLSEVAKSENSGQTLWDWTHTDDLHVAIAFLEELWPEADFKLEDIEHSRDRVFSDQLQAFSKQKLTPPSDDNLDPRFEILRHVKSTPSIPYIGRLLRTGGDDLIPKETVRRWRAEIKWRPHGEEVTKYSGRLLHLLIYDGNVDFEEVREWHAREKSEGRRSSSPRRTHSLGIGREYQALSRRRGEVARVLQQ